MSRKHSGAVAKFLLKWLVIPVGLAAVGFFVVGPRLGEQGFKSATTPDTPAPAPVEESDPTPHTKIGEPEVEVTARPISRRRSPRRSTRRPSPPREEPTTSHAPTEVPPNESDPGGG